MPPTDLKAAARCARHRRRHGGFSLMELVMVIVIVGIIFAIGATLLGRVFQSYASTREIGGAEWQGVVALERLSRELRHMHSRTYLVMSPATEITFADNDGATARVFLNGTALTLSTGGVAYPLADGIGSLGFFYLRNDGQTAATGSANTHYIAVRLTVQDGDYSETLRSNVHPRSFE